MNRVLKTTMIFSEKDGVQMAMDIYDKKVSRRDNHIYYRTDVTMSNIAKLCNLIDVYNREQDMIRRELTTSIVVPKPLYLHITSYGNINNIFFIRFKKFLH